MFARKRDTAPSRYPMLAAHHAQRRAWDDTPPSPEEHWRVYLWIRELQQVIADHERGQAAEIRAGRLGQGDAMALNWKRPLLEAAIERYKHGLEMGFTDYRKNAR